METVIYVTQSQILRDTLEGIWKVSTTHEVKAV